MTFVSKLAGRSARFQEVIKACQGILRSHPIAEEARNYLDGRVSKEAQDKYEFGYFPSDDALDVLMSRVDASLLKSVLLMYPKYISGGALPHGHFNNHNLIMPFKNVYGEIVSIVGRTLLSSEEQEAQDVKKYKYSLASNKQLYLFGIDQAKDAIIELDFVICVEGQFDCISCHDHGIKNVVACGGSDVLPFQFFQLRRYTNNLVLLLDGDDAGKRARGKIKKRYSQYANIGAITPPDKYKDIDEFLQKSDSEKRDHVVNVLKTLHKQIGSKRVEV